MSVVPNRGQHSPPAAAPPESLESYARPTDTATQDAHAEAAVMTENATNTPERPPDQTMDPMEGVVKEGEGSDSCPPARQEQEQSAPSPKLVEDAPVDTDKLPAQESAHVQAQATAGEEKEQAPDAPADVHTQTQDLQEIQTTPAPDVPNPEPQPEPEPSNEPAGEPPPNISVPNNPVENLQNDDISAAQNNDSLEVANTAHVTAPSQPATLGSVVDTTRALLNGMNGNPDFNWGSMDVQPSSALGVHPDVLGYGQMGSPATALANLDEERQCAFAKLEFPDGDFYVTTYAVELGRDARAFKQEMRRRNQQESDDMGERPQTPMRPSAPSVASICRSNLSECGGIMGGDDYHVDVAPRKRKKKKENKSNSSSSQRPSRIGSIATPHDVFEPINYNDLAMVSNQQDSGSLLPDPHEVPLVPIHPPMSDDGPIGHKGISRKHLKIYYSFDKGCFEMKVLGRNGAFLNNDHFVPSDDAVSLDDGDVIQIGAVRITFRLPNDPADEDVQSETDSISGGISLNFEDGRGQSIVPEDESEDDYGFNNHYEYNPAYGWASEEEFSGDDDDLEDDYQEQQPRQPKVKLKLKLKAPSKDKRPESKARPRSEAGIKKKKKKDKLKAKREAKISGKSAPKPQAKEKSEELARERELEKQEKEREREEKKKEKKEKKEKEKVASKTASKTASKMPSKAPSKAPAKTVEKPPKERKEDEAKSQVTIVPPEDIPKPSTEVPPPDAKPEGEVEEEAKPAEKKPDAQPNKDSSGRRVLTAEEAERLGLEPGTVIERKKGPGRPPKDGIMSKREKAEILRRKKEAEKARKLGLDPGDLSKVDLSRPRKESREGDGKSAEKKIKSEGPEGEGATVEGGDQNAEKKSVKISRPLRSPSPEMKESDYTEEQLQRPAANYVVLIHEAISNSKEGKLNLQQIYAAIERKYPYYKFKTSTTGWQSSVRHNLGQHEAFRKAEKEGKGWMWAINPGVSIEKERRKRVTPPPQTQPRPYYPGAHPSPYGYPQGGMPPYGHPSVPYPPRPPGAPGQPQAGAQQRTYQSPYGGQPLGQAAQPRPAHQSPYGAPGARPPYPSPYGSAYGQPPAASQSAYPPASSSSTHPTAAGAYSTAGPSPSPYAPTSGPPSYQSGAAPTAYAPRPPYGQPPQAGQTPYSQHAQQPAQAKPPMGVSNQSNQHGMEPLPPRKPDLYSDSAPYAVLLNSFRDHYLRHAHNKLSRTLTKNEIAELTDRGLERALHPERYQNQKPVEQMDQKEKDDLKDEKDIENAVKEMMKKFKYGYVLDQAESKIGKPPQASVPGPAPVAHAPNQAQPHTGPLPQSSTSPATAASAPGQNPPQANPPAPSPAPASASNPAQAAAASTKLMHASPGQGPSQSPLPHQAHQVQPQPGTAHHSVPTAPMNTHAQPAHPSGTMSTANAVPKSASPPQSGSAPVAPMQMSGSAPRAPVPSAHAPQAMDTRPSVPQPQALPPRNNGTSTPVPPPVEALTPLGGSPKNGTPVTSAAPSPRPAPSAIRTAFSGKSPSPAPAPSTMAGIKRSAPDAGSGNGDRPGEKQEGESEAKKAKTEEKV